MSSGRKLPPVDWAGAGSTTSTPLPGTFLGLALDLASGRLYDLVDDISDVMGLRATRPSAAIVKVMSVPDSRCVRVVSPDDHVSIEFHEILIHDLEEEELPFVAMSELGCLRLDWPKTLFTFMSRYQFDLDQMRKDCRERFGSTQSGSCTHFGKHIQQNLDKHIVLYHMELAQLWCTIWKGTAQDSTVSEAGEFGTLVPALDSISRTVDQSVTSCCCGRYSVVQSHWSATVPPLSGR